MIDYTSASRFIGPGGGGATAVELIDRIAAGLPLSALERVAKAASGAARATPAHTFIVNQIVPKATLSRRQKGDALSPREGEVVARLAAIIATATDVWGDEEAARRFLYREHPMLDGRRPIDLVLQSEIGADAVAGILGRLQYGSAA